MDPSTRPWPEGKESGGRVGGREGGVSQLSLNYVVIRFVPVNFKLTFIEVIGAHCPPEDGLKGVVILTG